MSLACFGRNEMKSIENFKFINFLWLNRLNLDFPCSDIRSDSNNCNAAPIQISVIKSIFGPPSNWIVSKIGRVEKERHKNIMLT